MLKIVGALKVSIIYIYIFDKRLFFIIYNSLIMRGKNQTLNIFVRNTKKESVHELKNFRNTHFKGEKKEKEKKKKKRSF